MALKINYNYQSDFTHANVLNTEFAMNKNMEKLATGHRINSAADDAAGLYIADQLKTYAVSLDQGTKNAQDGVSIAQIAQGSMQNVYNILNDIKSKTIQAANTTDKDARGQLQQDINKLADTIKKVFSDTEFNGLHIFRSGQTGNTKYPSVFKIHYGGRKDQKVVINALDAYVCAGTSDSKPSEVNIGTVDNTIDVTKQSNANSSIQKVDDLIKAVDKQNAVFGSKQVELEKIISNNETQKINTSDAEGRIRNVDFAKEMSEFTKNKILMQSGMSMLAQANQQSQLVLQLLR